MDISPLINAIEKLEKGFERYEQDVLDEQIRDGLIQRFEFTYELSHKKLKRYLEMASANTEEIDGLSFQGLIRTANEKGLLKSDWAVWREYREMRGKTSHAYDAGIALKNTGIYR